MLHASCSNLAFNLISTFERGDVVYHILCACLALLPAAWHGGLSSNLHAGGHIRRVHEEREDFPHEMALKPLQREFLRPLPKQQAEKTLRKILDGLTGCPAGAHFTWDSHPLLFLSGGDP